MSAHVVPCSASTVSVNVNGSVISTSGGGAQSASPAPAPAPAAAAPAPAAAAPPAEEKKTASRAQKEYTLAEIAKHKTEDDCWVAVNGQVLDVTSFLSDHPGGKMAIMTFAGKVCACGRLWRRERVVMLRTEQDATEEFNMLHEKNVVEKFAPHCIIGTLKPGSKL